MYILYIVKKDKIHKCFQNGKFRCYFDWLLYYDLSFPVKSLQKLQTRVVNILKIVNF